MKQDELSLAEMETLIQRGETLTVEFKGDWEGHNHGLNGLPDRDLVAAVVALANTKGGYLFLGVEDNGEITGLRPKHQDLTGMAAMIANKTNPALNVSIFPYHLQNNMIAVIAVESSRQLISTSDGLLLKRRLKVDNKPEAVPFYPHEFISRQSSLGLMDPSSMTFPEIPISQLDPLQRIRLRQAIKLYHGDSALLDLADEELDGALQLIAEKNGEWHPTVTGLLLLGTEKLLRQYLPAYEVAFQVLEGTEVRVNEFFHLPLLETFEAIEQHMKKWIVEKEMEFGLFRIPVPNYDQRAFREAFVNALVHRDFSILGFVQVKLDDTGLLISSPGGFMDGVTLNNLLVTPPRSRNPQLADTIKRIGLAERTGRGIDRIYEGMLRYGRPAPDYSLSSDFNVSVFLVNSAPDLNFMQMLLEHEKDGKVLPIDSLLILSELREMRRLPCSDLAAVVQKPERAVHAELEKLLECGILERQGAGRGSSYTLSAKLYAQAGKKTEYIRQKGFSIIQQEHMIEQFIEAHGKIVRGDVMKMCYLSGRQAYYVLQKMVSAGKILKHGGKIDAFYTRATT
mgnify:CR=1 FL=1